MGDSSAWKWWKVTSCTYLWLNIVNCLLTKMFFSLLDKLLVALISIRLSWKITGNSIIVRKSSSFHPLALPSSMWLLPHGLKWLLEIQPSCPHSRHTYLSGHYTWYFYLHAPGYNLDTWLFLSTRVVEKCGIYHMAVYLAEKQDTYC